VISHPGPVEHRHEHTLQVDVVAEDQVQAVACLKENFETVKSVLLCITRSQNFLSDMLRLEPDLQLLHLLGVCVRGDAQLGLDGISHLLL
jgi:hypothetical protein